MTRYDKSRELMARAERVVPGGISSQIRKLEPAGEPLFFTHGDGALTWDADGNQYIDYIQGMGPNIFGHAPSFVTAAVAEAIQRGYVFAAQFEQELEVAEMAADAVPIPDCTVRFAGSGTEIVQLALRLARGWTRRTKFIRFEGHYHGWLDSVNWSVHPDLAEAGNASAPNPVGESQGMDPGAADQMIVCEWNSVERLEQAFDRNRGEVAAVIMEPINANTNCIMPQPGYLEAAKDMCEREGALLIFDEVITGFRVAYGGAQELLGITPDLATYAKSLAAGFPIAMLAGRREVMDMLGSGEVYHGGSYNSNVISIAAAHATLTHMRQNRDNATTTELVNSDRTATEPAERANTDRNATTELVNGDRAATETAERANYDLIATTELVNSDRAAADTAKRANTDTSERTSRDSIFTHMSNHGNHLMEGLRTVAAELDSDLHVQGLGTVFGISFNPSGEIIRNYRDHATKCDPAAYTTFARNMMQQGIRLSSNGRIHLSSAHTKAQVEATIAATREVLGNHTS